MQSTNFIQTVCHSITDIIQGQRHFLEGKMSELEKEAIEAVRTFWKLNSLRGNKNLLKALEAVHPNFMGFGSTRIETYNNAEIFKRSVKNEFSENPE